MVGDNGGGLCGCGGGHCLGERVVRGRGRWVGKGGHPRVGGDLSHAVRREWSLGGQRRHHGLQGGGGGGGGGTDEGGETAGSDGYTT